MEERVAASRDEVGSNPIENSWRISLNLWRMQCRSGFGPTYRWGLAQRRIGFLRGQCAMAMSGAEVRAFTYGSPTDHRSKGPLVATVAERSNIDVTYAQPSPEEQIEDFWDTLSAQGAPFPDPSIVAQYAVLSRHTGKA